MRLSVPMLAQAILEYLGQHEQDFDGFVVDLFKMNEEGGVQVRFRADDANKRLLVRATGVGSGMETLWEREFALKIELISDV
jgi:hypothetical protein